MTQQGKYEDRPRLFEAVSDLILSVCTAATYHHILLKKKKFPQGRDMCLHSTNEEVKQQRGSFISS